MENLSRRALHSVLHSVALNYLRAACLHRCSCILRGVLHLMPKISMFCALSQNDQQPFEK